MIEQKYKADASNISLYKFILINKDESSHELSVIKSELVFENVGNRLARNIQYRLDFYSLKGNYQFYSIPNKRDSVDPKRNSTMRPFTLVTKVYENLFTVRIHVSWDDEALGEEMNKTFDFKCYKNTHERAYNMHALTDSEIETINKFEPVRTENYINKPCANYGISIYHLDSKQTQSVNFR
ncbi:MAG: hypothetical protein JKX79_11680 [Labilibaculum sp.]|nr:hypothetical protein [Labilibaculum sp.]